MAATVYAIDNAWKERLDIFRRQPRANLRNAVIALRHAPEWNGVLATNELTYYINAVKQTPWGSTTQTWTDTDDLRTTEWLQSKNINVASNVAREAVHVVASENSFHPVKDYLESLVWDEKPRIDTWLADYLSAEPDPDVVYLRAISSKFLISAVARVMSPGCQVDTCLVLQGKQGTGKSTALRTLAGDWFADQMSTLTSKDASMQTRVWIMELKEFDVVLKSDINTVKAFLDRRIDHFRPPYGRRVIDVPRHCVFAGTVNGDDYLLDETGARRFWPANTGTVKMGELEAARDQLWAEAVVRWRAKEKWHLFEDDILSSAADAQAERYRADLWTDKVEAFVFGKDQVTAVDVLCQAIHKEVKECSDRDAIRIGKIMAFLGWKRKRLRDGATRTRVYVKS